MKETAIDWLIKKIDLDNLNPTQIEWHEAINEAKKTHLVISQFAAFPLLRSLTSYKVTSLLTHKSLL